MRLQNVVSSLGCTYIVPAISFMFFSAAAHS